MFVVLLFKIHDINILWKEQISFYKMSMILKPEVYEASKFNKFTVSADGTRLPPLYPPLSLQTIFRQWARPECRLKITPPYSFKPEDFELCRSSTFQSEDYLF